jgi:hypothetical protein
MSKNPKSEYRNPKQMQNPNRQTPNPRLPRFEHRPFGFVSDFGFRNSDLALLSSPLRCLDFFVSFRLGRCFNRPERGLAKTPRLFWILPIELNAF